MVGERCKTYLSIDASAAKFVFDNHHDDSKHPHDQRVIANPLPLLEQGLPSSQAITNIGPVFTQTVRSCKKQTPTLFVCLSEPRPTSFRVQSVFFMWIPWEAFSTFFVYLLQFPFVWHLWRSKTSNLGYVFLRLGTLMFLSHWKPYDWGAKKKSQSTLASKKIRRNISWY